MARVGRAPPASRYVQGDKGYSTSSMVYSPGLGIDFYVLANGIVRVKAITAGSTAAEDGRIKERDVLMTFNGVLVGSLALENVRQLLGEVPQGSVNGMHFLDGAAYDSIGAGISLRQNVELGHHCFFVCLLANTALECRDVSAPSCHELFAFTDTASFKEQLSSSRNALPSSLRRDLTAIPPMFSPQEPRRTSTVRGTALADVSSSSYDMYPPPHTSTVRGTALADTAARRASLYSETSLLFGTPSGLTLSHSLARTLSRSQRCHVGAFA